MWRNHRATIAETESIISIADMLSGEHRGCFGFTLRLEIENPACGRGFCVSSCEGQRGFSLHANHRMECAFMSIERDDLTGRFLRSLLEHRDPATVSEFLRTLASQLARQSDLDLASSRCVSPYSELLGQIDPAYAKCFSRHYFRACNCLRSQKPQT